jgi:GNAT superfamily N-acetyltransferase
MFQRFFLLFLALCVFACPTVSQANFSDSECVASFIPVVLTETSQLNPDDPFFDSLWTDYPEFKDWLRQISIERRKAFIARGPRANAIAALAIVKTVQETTLKISTFKVSSDYKARGLGSVVMSTVVRWARDKGYREIIINVYPKHSGLLEFLEKRDFVPVDLSEKGELILRHQIRI